jgi:hypothetical protein
VSEIERELQAALRKMTSMVLLKKLWDHCIYSKGDYFE